METQPTQTTAQAREREMGAEADIRQLLDNYANAFRSASVDDLNAFYSPDIVAFDLMGPLQFKGRDAYSKAWREAAEMMKAPWIWEPRDEKIHVGENVAFVHHLVNCGGTAKDGQVNSGWIRHTLGLRKINGQWLIVHEQFSVPVDMKSGKGLMDLSPESATH